MQSTRSDLSKAYLALAALCIIWSTTYTGIKYAVRDFPPFLLVGIRQTAAGLLLLGLGAASGKVHWPGRKYVLRQSLTGLFMITGGNGFVTWAMQFISSGLSAVIGSLTPVVVVLINLAWKGSERINLLMGLGVLVGFGGLGIIFSEGWGDFMKPDYRWGILASFGSCFTWSLGTVMAKRFNAMSVSPIFNSGLQITAGGLGGFVMSAIFDPTHSIHHSWEGWLSVAYLAIVGSALAFTLYMFMLRHLTATVASLYTYINPVLAIFLGWLFLGENFGSWAILGVAFTLLGVWMVNAGQRRL